MFWTMHTGIIAVIAMVFARYVGVLRPAGRRRPPRASPSPRSSSLSADQLRRRAAGQPRADDAHDLKVAAVVAIIAVALRRRSTRAACRRHAGPQPRARFRRCRAFVARRRRRPVRVRRLAHGDLRGRGDASTPERTIPRALRRRRRSIVTASATSRSTPRISTCCRLDAIAVVDARRRRRRRRRARTRRRARSCRRSSSLSDVRRAERRHSRRPARLSRDGARRTARSRGSATIHPRFRTPHRAIAAARRCGRRPRGDRAPTARCSRASSTPSGSSSR